MKTSIETRPIPVSLYIHIPWCIKKCPYCDFNSHVFQHPNNQSHNSLPEREYITRLIEDLQQQLDLLQGRCIETIFIGGGTPSLFAAESYEYLFNQLTQHVKLAPELEITLEANPGTVEQNRFRAYFALGINRLSLGIQSFDNEKLMALGRIHDGEQARRAIETARQAGFCNFNLDLMHGLPQQTLAQALSDLEIALSFQPSHLSWYQLTLEPNTLFHKFPPALPQHDQLWEIQQTGLQLLAAAGFTPYEVSAYCDNPLHQCRHNLNYWYFGDYIGIGAGAHSKMTNLNDGTVWRNWKVKHPKDYLNPNKALVAEHTQISQSQLSFEFMLNALRLQQPIPVALFTARTGLQLIDISDPLTAAQQQGLMNIENDCFVVTQFGQRFLNDLIELFL